MEHAHGTACRAVGRDERSARPRHTWWGEAPEHPLRACEELASVKSPDVVRHIGAPSHGSERRSNVWFGQQKLIDGDPVERVLIRGSAGYPRLGTASGVAKRWGPSMPAVSLAP